MAGRGPAVPAYFFSRLLSQPPVIPTSWVNPAHHMEKLPTANAASLMNDAPEDAQFFKAKIQSCE